jgi:hypothetical protein
MRKYGMKKTLASALLVSLPGLASATCAEGDLLGSWQFYVNLPPAASCPVIISGNPIKVTGGCAANDSAYYFVTGSLVWRPDCQVLGQFVLTKSGSTNVQRLEIQGFIVKGSNAMTGLTVSYDPGMSGGLFNAVKK